MPDDILTQYHGHTCLKCGQEEREPSQKWCATCRDASRKWRESYANQILCPPGLPRPQRPWRRSAPMASVRAVATGNGSTGQKACGPAEPVVSTPPTPRRNAPCDEQSEVC